MGVGLDNYRLYLERPLIRKLKAAKFGFDLLLIIGCALSAFVLLKFPDKAKVRDVVGDVFLASGLLPMLLALPLLLARWSMGGTDHRRRRRSRNNDDGDPAEDAPLEGDGQSARPCLRRWFCELGRCYFLRDTNTAIAYTIYICMAVGGGVTLANSHKGPTEFVEAVAGIFAEVALIYFIVTVLRVPTVDDDETRAFLSSAEEAQLEASGSLHAPFAIPVDFAFAGEYHADLRALFPDAVRAEDYAGLDDAVLMRARAIARARTKTVAGAHRLAGAAVRHRAEDRSRVVSALLNASAPGWGSPFYVCALGRADARSLGGGLLAGLLAIVRGGAPTAGDRFVCEAAALSLGNLYFGTRNAAASSLLFALWGRHAISDVRASCATAIAAVAGPLATRPVGADGAAVAHAAFLAEVGAPAALRAYGHDLGAAKAFFAARLVDTAPLELECADGDDRGGEGEGGGLRALHAGVAAPAGTNARRMALLAACAALRRYAGAGPRCDALAEARRVLLGAEIAAAEHKHPDPAAVDPDANAAELEALADACGPAVALAAARALLLVLVRTDGPLCDPLSGHLASALALEAAARACRCLRVSRSPGGGHPGEDGNSLFLYSEEWNVELQRRVWAVGMAAATTSIFKSVRDGGCALLRASGYEHLGLLDCFSAAAARALAAAGFTPEAVRGVLEAHLPPPLLAVLLGDDEDAPPAAGGAAAAAGSGRSSGSDAAAGVGNPRKHPSLLLLAALAKGKSFRDTSLQNRMNSPDRLERFAGLVGVGVMAATGHAGAARLRRAVLPGIVGSEPVSDVRELSVAVLAAHAGRGRCGRCCGSLACLACCCADEEEVEGGDRRAVLLRAERARLEARLAGASRTASPSPMSPIIVDGADVKVEVAR